MVKLKGYEDYPMYFGSSPEILKMAAELRKEMTAAEKQLWNCVRNRKINGFRFRRQHPIGIFIADFFCYEAKLVIEIDGEVHNDAYQQERDIERTKILNNLGLRELRFTNKEVMTHLDAVLQKIRTSLESL